MDASHVIDALSASFFGLLGIWAAVDRRHWFIRFVVVSGILLVMLLIPAYEVVIEFGLQITIIMAGVWLARGRRTWRPRLSIETVLLAMVVVAVTTAVIARIPDLHPGVWAFLLTVGLCTGYAGLLALWVVCGRARLRTRLIFGLFGLGLFVLLFHFGEAVQHALWRSSTGFNKQALFEFYAHEQTARWMSRMLPSIVLAAIILVSGLALARASRWFAVNPPHGPMPSPRNVIAARLGLGVLLVAVVAPLAYLFYRLLTPTPLTNEQLPIPNGYDDFIAAGELAPAEVVDFNSVGNRPTRSVLERYNRMITPAIDRIMAGLQKECRVSELVVNQRGLSDRDYEALIRAMHAVFIRLRFAHEYGTSEELVEASLTCLRFGHEVTRGAGALPDVSEGCEQMAANYLSNCLQQLDAPASRALAAELWRVDANREPLSARRARQRIIEQNRSWTENLQVIIDDWSMRDYFEHELSRPRWVQCYTRLLMTNAAARAFTLDRGPPPNALAELVPDYLPAEPLDPYTDQPLKYRCLGSGYSIYSTGPDGDDDQARQMSPTPDSIDYDVVVHGPQPPPFWQNLIRRSGSALYDAYLRSKGGSVEALQNEAASNSSVQGPG